MDFDARIYGDAVAAILALDDSGNRRMPLAMGVCSSKEAARQIASGDAQSLFPRAPHSEAAYSGLWLYFSCLDESHSVSQQIHSPEGSFWHGIMHRQEPDAGNSAYWFRRTGRHPVFPALRDEAARLATARPDASFTVEDEWDPFAFIDFCEQARRRPGSEHEELALDIQRVEWQILFDYCARPNR